jgi:hypothetical protein
MDHVANSTMDRLGRMDHLRHERKFNIKKREKLASWLLFSAYFATKSHGHSLVAETHAKDRQVGFAKDLKAYTKVLFHTLSDYVYNAAREPV